MLAVPTERGAIRNRPNGWRESIAEAGALPLPYCRLARSTSGGATIDLCHNIGHVRRGQQRRVNYAETEVIGQQSNCSFMVRHC